MQDVRIVFLGTSSGVPSPDRNVSSLAIVLDGTVLLFDCGEGTQHQLLRAPVRSGAIDVVFITHLHGDHVYGLPGLLATLSMSGRTAPLTVVGPEGVGAYLDAVLTTSYHHPHFPIVVQSPPYRGEGFTVTHAPLEHSIPAFGYCVVEDDRPGRFDPERARALSIPEGPEWRALQQANDPRVCGPARPGRRVAYCTDTRPCASAAELARGSDVLIHESTYAEELRAEADARLHSTAMGAASVAADAGVALLILTHFSTRYRDVAPLVEEARTVFPNVEAASDFAVFEVAAP